MAEVTGLRNNALPYPVYGAPWGVVFPMLDADGDLVTGATTPDAEVSKNGDTFADCTNESTEIATNSGVYYLLLTGTEMTADVVAVIAKSATAGMKTTTLTFYPRKLVSLRSGTVGANAADGTTLQLDSSAVAIDDYYNGCLLVAVIDSVTEARIISDYAGSTKVCTVSPAFNTAPDNNDTFTVYLPEGRQITQSDMYGILGTATSTPATAGILDVNVKNIDNDAASASGTVTFPNATLASTTNITAGTVTTATNVTTVNGLAANVITAASMAADASTEINAAVLAILGTPAGASMSADIAAIEAQTDDIGVAGAGLTDLGGMSTTMKAQVEAEVDDALGSGTGTALTAIPWNASWDAEVQSEVDDALVAQNLDHLVKAAVDTNFATTVHLDSVIGHLADAGTTATFDRTTDALEALQAEHDATQAAVDTVDNLLDTEIAAIKAKTDQLTFTTANQVDATAVTNSDKTGYRLSATGVDDVLDEVVEGSYTVRQFLRLLASSLGGKLSGAATATITIRNASDTKDVVVATVDADGNRSAVTLDLT